MAPQRRGEIARLAEATFERRYGGIRGLREIDFAVMARAVGAATRSRGEFLSFLLFDYEFTRALMELGRRDAPGGFAATLNSGVATRATIFRSDGWSAVA